jgi:alpha-beta hydrolase superfamily lysophospholipase
MIPSVPDVLVGGVDGSNEVEAAEGILFIYHGTPSYSSRVRTALISISMGGFIVQKYLEKYDAPAAGLQASAPPITAWLRQDGPKLQMKV